MSSHRILPRSSKKAVTPQKYQPEDVKGAIFSTAPDDVHASFSIQFQSHKRHSVRLWMESKHVNIEKEEAEYFQQLARHLTTSSCQVCPRSVSERFKTNGTGAGWFLNNFTAWGENLLWILKVFPTCTASEDSS